MDTSNPEKHCIVRSNDYVHRVYDGTRIASAGHKFTNRIKRRVLSWQENI